MSFSWERGFSSFFAIIQARRFALWAEVLLFLMIGDLGPKSSVAQVTGNPSFLPIIIPFFHLVPPSFALFVVKFFYRGPCIFFAQVSSPLYSFLGSLLLPHL